MSGPPLLPEDSEPGTAPYYRPGMVIEGDPEQLRTLASGYFGLRILLPIHLVVVLWQCTAPYLPVFIASTIIFFAATVPFTLKIARARNYPPAHGFLASTAIAVSACVFVGFVGYFVMLGEAAKEFRRCGFAVGLLGPNLKEVYRRIAELDALPKWSKGRLPD